MAIVMFTDWDEQVKLTAQELVRGRGSTLLAADEALTRELPDVSADMALPVGDAFDGDLQ